MAVNNDDPWLRNGPDENVGYNNYLEVGINDIPNIFASLNGLSTRGARSAKDYGVSKLEKRATSREQLRGSNSAVVVGYNLTVYAKK